MLLLYCDQNGVVLGWHDANQLIELSAYPTAVRIIPYDQPITTLSKIGPDPVYPVRDTRSYAQPIETTQGLINYAAQVRFESVNKGFTFNAASGAIQVQTDRESYMLVGNTATYAATLPPTQIIDFTQTGTHSQLTAAEMQALFNQFSALIQQCRSIEAQCIFDLNSASPTILHYADVDAKFASVRSAGK